MESHGVPSGAATYKYQSILVGKTKPYKKLTSKYLAKKDNPDEMMEQ